VSVSFIYICSLVVLNRYITSSHHTLTCKVLSRHSYQKRFTYETVVI